MNQGKDVKVWGSMLYRCEDCGHEKRMYLQVGAGGPKDKRKQPIPFTILCPACQKERPYEGFPRMNHVDWHNDEHFVPRPLKSEESYFALDFEADCAQPVIKQSEEGDNQ